MFNVETERGAKRASNWVGGPTRPDGGPRLPPGRRPGVPPPPPRARPALPSHQRGPRCRARAGARLWGTGGGAPGPPARKLPPLRHAIGRRSPGRGGRGAARGGGQGASREAHSGIREEGRGAGEGAWGMEINPQGWGDPGVSSGSRHLRGVGVSATLWHSQFSLINVDENLTCACRRCFVLNAKNRACSSLHTVEH